MSRWTLSPLRAKRLSLLGCAAAMSVLVAWGCKTMEPVTQFAASVGVATGTITPDQARSMTRVAGAVGKSFEDITPEQEYYIGRAVAASVIGKYRPYGNEAANHYVNLVGQTLAQASKRPETFGGYHFLILDSGEINAFAAPGGLILVTRGMLRLCKNEDELAAVLAHEIGHVEGQHGLRAIKSSRLTTAFTVLAQESVRQLAGGEIGQLMEAFEGSVGDVVSTLTTSGYSRELEREADKSAVAILKGVGYDPRGLTAMLAEMHARLRPGGLDFAKTHPDPNDRISDVESLIQARGPAPSPASASIRTKRFQQAMKSI